MPSDPAKMYRWRVWTDEQRRRILQERTARNHPSHSPAHIESDTTTLYMITSACFEHRPIIGESDERITEFANRLLDTLNQSCRAILAWVVLPNHYHVLVDTPSVKRTLRELGRYHGRTSFDWNGQDGKRGRQVWCNAAETVMKSEGHYYATINYLLHNPVHHGYCERWTDWPLSSAAEYLEQVGRDVAMRRWQAYPLYEYGQSWDPPEL